MIIAKCDGWLVRLIVAVSLVASLGMENGLSHALHKSGLRAGPAIFQAGYTLVFIAPTRQSIA